MRPFLTAAILAALAALPAFAAPANAPAHDLRLTRFVSGLDKPVDLQHAPGEPNRLYAVEQTGRIRLIQGGQLRREPFLYVTEATQSANERGLLGLAFHPRYRDNGWFYVNYTDRNGDTRVVRYTARADRRTADPASAKVILRQDQPFSNHNGGQVIFGPDGMLYIPLGDGGSGGDPGNRAQDLGTALGKILRLDVNHGDPYKVPRDNPFVSRRGAQPEIWALGVRNPWRIAFDPTSGLVYVADVGQNQWEEVNVVRASRAGLNYGWRRYEGLHTFRRDGRDPPGLIVPLVEYSHQEGCSVTGGVVYRGQRIRSLVGAYLYSDYCNGWIRSFRVVGGAAVERKQYSLESPGYITSFGTDLDGEVYVVCHDGAIYRIDPAE